MAFMEVEDYYIYDNHKGKLFAAYIYEKSGDIDRDINSINNRLEKLDRAIKNGLDESKTICPFILER